MEASVGGAARPGAVPLQGPSPQPATGGKPIKLPRSSLLGRYPQTPNFKTANAVPASIHKRQ